MLKNKQVVRLPVTLIIVRVISKILSTPRSTTPTGGIPAAINMVDSIAIPVPGTDSAPIDAASAVSEIKSIVVNPKLTSKS